MGKTPATPADDLMRRLQVMLYEFHAFGRFEEARPHVLWLMEIAEKSAAGPSRCSQRSIPDLTPAEPRN